MARDGGEGQVDGIRESVVGSLVFHLAGEDDGGGKTHHVAATKVEDLVY